MGSEATSGFDLNEQFGLYASANFQDAQDTMPAGAHLEALGGQGAVPGIVHQSLNRHIRESLPPRSPAMLPMGTNWRKRLRETMIRQNETVLGFLHRPLADHETIGPVEQALRRYALRQDIDNTAVRPLQTLFTDLSGAAQISEEITSLLATKGASSLPEIRAQVMALIESYKETGEKLLDCENQLKLRLDKMDKVQRRVSSIIELQTNEAMPDLVAATEKYLEVSFRDMTIEPIYKELLFLYQKHIALRESIQLFKVANQASESMCIICLTDPVESAISPCGHTFCTTCIRRMVHECGVCRGRIKDRLKLYFS